MSFTTWYRPQLYDNHVIYDGHANIYALKHKHTSHTLASLPPPKPHNVKQGKGSEESLYLSETRIKRVISKSKTLFALLVVESNTSKEVKPLHNLAQLLLKECKDVFPNDLLLGLPPLREIEHQINLILGAPLSKTLAYRCNPNKSKEL